MIRDSELGGLAWTMPGLAGAWSGTSPADQEHRYVFQQEQVDRSPIHSRVAMCRVASVMI
jgi:hypothetical protein